MKEGFARPGTRPPTVAARATTGARLHALDWLRAFVMLIGIVFHVAEAAQEHQTAPSESIRIFLFVSRAWRMPLFFFLSGIFLELSRQKKGERQTATSRLQRVALPLLLALATILPLDWVAHAAYFDSASGAIPNFNWLRDGSGEFFRRLAKPRLHHLWFLYYLLGFSALWLGFARISKPEKRGWRMPASVGVLALALFGVCVTAKLQPGYRGRTDSLVYQPIEFFYYLPFFLVGACAYLLKVPSYKGSYKTLSLLPLVLLSGYLAYQAEGAVEVRIVSQAVFVLSGTSLVFLLTLTTLGRQSRWVEFFVASAYWTYLVHEPILYIYGSALKTYRWSLGLEISVLSILVYATCFLTFRCFVQYRTAEKFLNGKLSRRFTDQK